MQVQLHNGKKISGNKNSSGQNCWLSSLFYIDITYRHDKNTTLQRSIYNKKKKKRTTI